MRVSLLVLLALASADRAVANPCAAARIDGRSLLTAGPQRGIRIAEEAIRIHITTIKDGGQDIIGAKTKRFDIAYTFVNKGPAREVVMGFPVVVPLVALGRDEKAPPLAGFKVSGDGVGRRVGPKAATFTRWTRRAVLHWCERFAIKKLRKAMRAGRRKTYRFDREAIHLLPRDEDGDREVIGWYFWRQRFEKGETRLRVGYTMRGGGLCQTTYILRTARLWGGGVIGKLSISLTVADPRQLKRFSAKLGQLRPRRLGLRRGAQAPQQAQQAAAGGRKAGAGRGVPSRRRPIKETIKPQTIVPAEGRKTWRFSRFKANRDLMIESRPCWEG
jgi:hypothetical protein